MHKKKAQSLAEADRLLTQLFTHAHSLTGIFFSGNKKRFCLATDTIKVLSSSGWTSARSPGHLQNAAHPQLMWRWMDGRACVSECLWERREVGGGGEAGGGILYSFTRGWAEGPRQQQLPPF